MTYIPRTLERTLVFVALAASVLVAAPASAATLSLSSTDGGATLYMYWSWVGGVRKTTGFHIKDVRCDGRTPMVVLYRAGVAYPPYYNRLGCGKDVWYGNDLYFDAVKVCNPILKDPYTWAYCGPLVRP